jgi:hypothetical protein
MCENKFGSGNSREKDKGKRGLYFIESTLVGSCFPPVEKAGASENLRTGADRQHVFDRSITTQIQPFQKLHNGSSILLSIRSPTHQISISSLNFQTTSTLQALRT